MGNIYYYSGTTGLILPKVE